MKNIYIILIALCFTGFITSCEDDNGNYDTSFQASIVVEANIQYDATTFAGVDATSPIKLKFTEPVNPNTVHSAIRMFPENDEENLINLIITFEDNNKVINIQPTNILQYFMKYKLNIWQDIYSEKGVLLNTGRSYTIITDIDTSDKKPRISDEELLDKVQKQTFRYFWEGGHPVSGMARERSTSGDLVTTGGTGFGLMAMLVASERGFVTRTEAYNRVLKIASFLQASPTYHGAFPHWMNGATGATVSFSPTDNGADIVETALLIQGFLAARQYFNQPNEEELRIKITELWEGIEWTWFNRENKNTLYWNWSPDYDWDVNLPVQGWNEGLITYVLAAASPTHPISKVVYDTGWAKNGNMGNGKTFYGHTLPFGNDYGGPLFFSHYSFVRLNPNKLSDSYLNDYWVQVRNHALIHQGYSIENPKRYIGYSEDCWGLSASDGDKGYSAHSPTNDKGVIAPTAALASFPYTPEESMKALHYYYYKLGDHLWKEDGYGFYDAFNLSARWFDNQYIAIDQGPIIVMIENYRSGLLWNLFMAEPEIQTGLKKLGFTSSPK